MKAETNILVLDMITEHFGTAPSIQLAVILIYRAVGKIGLLKVGNLL
jgi:hypothetical protein